MIHPRIAYLTTSYPHVSHTFIRREILGLERLGYQITRIAIRPSDAVVDRADLAERTRTLHLLGQPKSWLLRQTVRGLLRARGALLTGLGATLRLARSSERGFLRHLAYLVEALSLLPYLEDHNIEHVHVHFGTNAAAVALLIKLMGGPSYSMMIHGPAEFDAPLGLGLGWKVRESRFTTAISRFCDAQIRRWVDREHWTKIHVVGCTVGDEWFQAAVPLSPNERDLICVGRLSEQKGHLTLLEAFAHAVEKGFTGRLVLVGDGALRGTIETRARALGIENRLDITGWADANQVRSHLLAGRALVLASFAEGLPVVIMEAMALLRPVICTSIMGIPELVVPDESGWLVPVCDPARMADAMLAVERAPIDQLHRIAAVAQERVRTHHADEEISKLDVLFRSSLRDIPVPESR